MNEMVNLIATCIVSSKNIFQNDDSQFLKTKYIHTQREEEEEEEEVGGKEDEQGQEEDGMA